MECFDVEMNDSRLAVQGIPDATKIIELKDGKAKRLSHLALHKHDLEFADQCLNELSNSNLTHLVQEALWRTAIIHFYKCFGISKSRFQLNFDKIFSEQPETAKTAFFYFRDLRDKHVVHDENAYSQSLAGAAINDGKKAHKVEKVVCLNVHSATLSNENYSNLKLLVVHTIQWVNEQFELCCNLITKDLELISYNILFQKPEIKFTVPSVEDISKKR